MRGEESPGGGVKRYTQMILVDAPAGGSPGRHRTRSHQEELTGLDVNSLTPLYWPFFSLLADLKERAGRSHD